MAAPQPRHVPTAKITPPRIGVPLLPRPPLLAEVRAGLARRLLVVWAEAGYGKTSLLLSAAVDLDTPVAWLTLDESDGDPHLFAAGLLAALRAVVPDLPAQPLDILTGGPALEDLRRTLIAVLDGLPGTVIVLDDVHTIEPHGASLRLLDDVLTVLPPSVHVAILTRTWPSLASLPRLQVQGQAVTLTASQLKFSTEEARAFLHHAHELDVEDAAVRQLVERTAGWPAAIQLIALSSRSSGLATAMTPPDLYAYLATTVLESLDPETRDFLLRTSILLELWPSICQAIVPDMDARRMLTQIARRQLFLYQLDDTGPRFRYHQLFAEFLRHRIAEELPPETVASLHKAAARHLEAEDVPDLAVRHYFAAGALDEAERVMKPLHGERLTARLAYAFRDLVVRLPENVQRGHPWMVRCGASAARFVGDYDLGLVLAKRALAAAEGTDSDLWTFCIHGIGAMLGHLDRHDETALLCESALETIPAHVQPRLHGGIISDLIDAFLQLGRVQDAAALLPSLERLTAQGTLPGKSLGLAFFLGELAATRMEYAEASAHYRRAARLGEERGSLTYQMIALLRILQVSVAQGDLAGARSLLERVKQLHEQTGERATDLTVMHVEGDVHLLAGEVDAADADYRRTLAAVRERESREPWVRAQLGLAAVAAARGQGAEAEALLLTCAEVCAQRRLLKLLPTVWLEQIHRSMTQGRAEDARAPLRALSRTMRAWKSPPGQARCDLIAAALSGQKSGEQTDLAAEAREPLARVLALPQTVLRDVVPYLRRESSWAVPLLLAALRTGIKSDQARELVASIGDEAVPYLLPLLSGGPLADTAVTLLGAIGDPRARRPLARLAARRGTPLGRAAQRALRGLREPEPVVLDIHLLGTLVVRRNGVPIGAAEWRTQKVKALLKYLILHRSRPIPQDELIDVVWPDVDPQAGAGRLKTTLKTLRQVLEPLLEGSRSTFVIRAGSTLRWADAGRARLDLDEYDRLVALAEGHQAAGRTSDAVVALDEAARLYRGDLLEDDRYDEWVISEREARREQHLRVLESLADLHATRQDFRRAMEVVQQIVVLDRLREPAYQRLIRYALARGERATALRAYETCARLLREELGVDPQPDTLALLEQARAVSPR